MKGKAPRTRGVQEPPPGCNDSAIVICETAAGVRLDVKLERETLWLTQKQIAALFQTERSVITEHLRNIFKSIELIQDSVCAKFALTAAVALWGLCLVLVLATAGCAINPVTGRTEMAMISVERERELGNQTALKVEAGMGLVADPVPLAYVQAVGGRVAKHSPRQDLAYTFQILNQPVPNAFALPNGNIYISRGLLALANSEDELAGVLGHEVVHVAARHTVRSVNMAVATSPLRIAAGLAGAAAGMIAPRIGEGIAGLGDVATAAILAPYGRSQEREADDLGVVLVARAGYDPQGLLFILRTMERDEALRKEGPPHQSFFDTHPTTPERVRETEERAAALRVEPVAPIAGTRVDFLARLDGLLIGDDPADGAFLESRFFQPTLGITLRFPAGWQTRNTARAVIGLTKDKEALLLVAVAAKGDDPLQVAREAAQEGGAVLLEQTRLLEINGLRAVRSAVSVETAGDPATLDVTWIAHGGVVYQLLGLCPTSRLAVYRGLFDDTVASFRAMTAADREQIRETRLRMVAALAGERPADIARRTGSVWSAAEIAVANALAVDARLAAGQLVKVALSGPYRGGRQE